MINRRELLLGAGAAAAPRWQSTLSGKFKLQPHHDGPLIHLDLDRAERESLHGLAPEWLQKRNPSSRSSRLPDLGICISRDRARVRWMHSGDEAGISLRHGSRGFVASWALPLWGFGGYIGYYPHEDLPLILSLGDGEYLCLDGNDNRRHFPAFSGYQLLFCCFFGAFDTFQRLDDICRQLSPEADADDTNFVFTTARSEDPPEVLLSAFGRAC